MPSRASTRVVVSNPLGMHARPAMTFAETASKFTANVSVAKDNETVDGKSIMQLLMLAATKGTKLRIEANGADAREAVNALKSLVESGFGSE